MFMCTCMQRLTIKHGSRFPPPPPPPSPVESGCTYVHSPSPEPHLLGKKIYPYLGYCLPLTVTKSTPFLAAFLGNLPETTAPNYPLFLENWHTHAGPLYAFDWGGGGESGHGLRQDIIYCTFVPLMFSSMSAWEHNHLICRYDELNLVFSWCLIETWWLGFRSDNVTQLLAHSCFIAIIS